MEIKNNSLAIDIGGTKIEVCKFDDKFKIIESKRYNTNDFSIGRKDFLNEIEKMIQDSFDNSISRIGISFNCPVKNGVIVHSPSLGGRMDLNIEEYFSKKFNCPVRAMNDACSMAIAESIFGKGKDIENFVLLNLGTGVKPVFVYNGQVIEGFTGCFGEIYEKRILITELDNASIRYDDLLAGLGVSNIYKRISNKEKTAKEVFDLYKEGDKDAVSTIIIYKKYLLMFLQELSYFYNPEIIILNVSIKKSFDLIISEILKEYRSETMDIFHFTNILISDIDYGACLGVVQK